MNALSRDMGFQIRAFAYDALDWGPARWEDLLRIGYEKEHGDVFFSSCPITGGISVPLQTMGTSNLLLSSRVFVRVPCFEPVYRLVLFWAC
jgi:hypothetical protein